MQAVIRHEGISRDGIGRADISGKRTGTNKRTATDPFPSKNNNPMQNKLITTLCSGLLAFALTSCDMIEDAYNKATELDAPVLSVTE